MCGMRTPAERAAATPRSGLNRNRAHARLTAAGQAASAERDAAGAWRPVSGQMRTSSGCSVPQSSAQDASRKEHPVLEPVAGAVAGFRARARGPGARLPRRGARQGRARARTGRTREALPIITAPGLPTGTPWWSSGKYETRASPTSARALTDPQRARIEKATAALLADDRKEPEAMFRAILQADPATWPRCAGWPPLSLAADKPHDAERLLRHALKQSAYLPLACRGLGRRWSRWAGSRRRRPPRATC